MEKVLLVIGTKETQHPSGTVGGDWAFKVTTAEGAPVGAWTSPTAEVQVELEPGVYLGSASRLASDGQTVLGTIAVTNFEVVNTQVPVLTADSLQVQGVA